MEEKKITDEITLESIKSKLEKISKEVEIANMAYPLDSRDFYAIVKKYYKVIDDLKQLKETNKDQSNLIDNMIKDITKEIRHFESIASDIDRHQVDYKSDSYNL